MATIDYDPDLIFRAQRNIVESNAESDDSYGSYTISDHEEFSCGLEYNLINQGDHKRRLWNRQAIDQLIVGRIHGDRWCWTTIATYLSWEHQDLSTVVEQELAYLFYHVQTFERYEHWRSKSGADEDVQRVINKIYAILQDERCKHASGSISHWRIQRPVLGLFYWFLVGKQHLFGYIKTLYIHSLDSKMIHLNQQY